MNFEEIKDYRFNDSLMIKKIGEIAMVYNRVNGDMYEFNDIGAEILLSLHDKKSVPDILSALSTEYDADIEDIKKDVFDFLKRMIELNVIIVPDDEFSKFFSIVYNEKLEVCEYQELRSAVGWESLDDLQAEKGLTNSDYIITCRANGKAVGCIRCIWDKGYTVFIMDAIVRPEWQRKGIGTQLINRLVDKLESGLAIGEKLMINLYSSAGKEDFYLKNGFTSGSGMVKWIRK